MMKTRRKLYVLLLALLIFGNGPTFARDLLDHEKELIVKAVKRNLLDPDSARFKWVPLQEEIRVYCGLVNSKNTFGGYTGDAPYIVFLFWTEQTLKGAMPLKIGTAAANSTASTVVIKQCAENGYTKLHLAE